MNINCILFLIIFIIILLIYIYKTPIKIQEDFYTYFNPFTSHTSTKFNFLYGEEYYNTAHYRNKYIFKYLTFGQAASDIYISKNMDKGYDMNFFRYLTMILLKGSKIINIQNFNYNKIYNLITDINRNLINFGLVSAPILAEVMLDYGGSKDNILKGDNLRFLFNTNQQYLLIITKKMYNINGIGDINNKYRVGIDYNGSSDHKLSKQLLDAFNKVENIDYIISYHMDNTNLLNNLIAGKVDIIFMTLSFPLESLTKYIDSNFTESLMILPLDDLNFKKFFNQHYYYSKTYIDLNKVSDNYLPVRINDRVYNRFNPYLQTISFFNIFVTNKFMDNKIVNQIVNVFFNNIRNFNKLEEFKENKLFRNYCASLNNVQLLIHPAAEEFYIKNGYITYTDNKNCGELVGRMACNKDTLTRHNLLNELSTQ